MSKRRQTNQITRETYHSDDDDSGDDRHGPPDIAATAVPQVMAARKILQPRSRKVNGTPATPSSSAFTPNPFQSIGSAFGSAPSADSPTPNPFSSLSTPSAGTSNLKPFEFGSPASSNFGGNNFKPNSTPSQPSAPPAPSTTAGSSKPFSSTEYVKFLKIRALNEKFSSTITASLAKDSLGELTGICKAYIGFFEKIEQETKEAAKSAAEFAQLKDDPPVQSAPASIPPATPGFSFKPATTTPSSSAPASAPQIPAFTFGSSTPASSGTSAVADKPATPSFSFASAETNKPATPAFSFGSSATTSAETNKPATPAFSFGSAATTSTAADKPVTPAFSFGSASTTSTTADKPATPAFSFGSASTTSTAADKPATPAFSFGSASTTSTAADKPATPSFSFSSVPQGQKAEPEHESDSESDSDDDGPKIEGPSFVAGANLLKPTSSPFTLDSSKISETPPVNGPTFQVSKAAATKPKDSPFKLNRTPAVTDSAPTLNAPSGSASPSKPAAASSGNSTPALAPTDSKPAFSFSPPKFSFGAANLLTPKPKEDESSKPTTPPQSEENGISGSPLKISSLGSGTSASLNPFTFTAGKPNSSTSSPFKFNVAAQSSASTSGASTSEGPSNGNTSGDATPKPATPVPESDRPAEASGAFTGFNFGGANSSSPLGSNTWSPDKGIKFGSDKGSAETTPKPMFNNPLSSTTTPTAPPAGPTFSFGSGNIGSVKPSIGFTFGKPASEPASSGSAFGSTSAFSNAFSLPKSENTSASAVPSVTPSADGDGEAEPPMKQIDLSLEKGPGEEDEEVVVQGRTRVFVYKTAAQQKEEREAKEQVEEGDNKPAIVGDKYEPIGLGPYRVLKNEKTGKTRILVRADGSGKVIINVPLRKKVTYGLHGSGLRLLDFPAADKVVTYLLKVKTLADAENLLKIVEENKA